VPLVANAAHIYIDRLRERLDPHWVPIFSPGQIVRNGDYGTLFDGSWERHGNVSEVGVDTAEADADPPQPYENFVSSDKYSLAGDGEVQVGGVTLLKGHISFEEK
jgi:hypothetical protein